MYISPNIEYIVVSASNFLSKMLIIDISMIIIGMEGITKLKFTKENIKTITALGVDYVSSGALTHSAPILDISLKHLKVTDSLQ